MFPFALSLAVAGPPEAELPPPPAVVSPVLDHRLLELSIAQHRRARVLGWTTLGGLAATVGGVGLVAGTCRTDACSGPGPTAGVILAVAGSFAYTGGLFGFQTVSAIAEGNAVDAGLRVRPKLGWAPLALTVGGAAVSFAGMSSQTQAGAGGVPSTPPAVTVGSLLTLGGVVLGCVQYASTGTAQRRRVTVAMSPTPNGARAAVRF